MTIKGRSNPAALPLGRFRAKMSKRGPKWQFWENRGQNVKLWFRNPQKAHPCEEPRRLTYFS